MKYPKTTCCCRCSFLSVWLYLPYISALPVLQYLHGLHDIGRSGWWYGASLIFGLVWSVWMVVKMLGLVSGMDLAHVDVESDAFVFTVLKEMWAEILIPYILYIAYSIVLLVWYCRDSQPGTNKYGENPKGVVE